MSDNVMRRTKATSSPVTRTAGEGTGRAPRVKPVRITVDLDPVMHKQLKLFAIEAETDASSIIRALLTQLGADTELASTITNHVHR